MIHAITNGYAGPIDGEHRLADEMEPASRDTGGIHDETGEDAGEGDAGDAVVEKAEAADPAPKIASPTQNSFFRPTRSPTLPATSKSPAKTHE
jgi:hypothetical protein